MSTTRKSRIGYKRTVVGILLTAVSVCSVAGQITPHSALKNFKLPKYNENSFRAYTLSGQEGIYDESQGFFTVELAVLKVYSGDENQLLQTTIKTDHAIFDLENDTASGDSQIDVQDEEFHLFGKGWTLDMPNKRITIENRGKIRFFQKLDFDLTEVF